MAHLDYTFTANDTGSKIRVTFINKFTGQLIVPFNGVYNALLLVKPAGGVVVQRNMSVLSGADDGSAEYQFTASELVVGDLQVQARATRVSNGEIFTELAVKIYKVGPVLQ